MELEQILQNHRFERRDLPPHHAHVVLRLDGQLVKITSREVFRVTGATELWLKEIVLIMGRSYESVALEQFGVLPASDRHADEGAGISSSASAADPVPMKSLSWIQERLREKPAPGRHSGSNGSREEFLAPAEE